MKYKLSLLQYYHISKNPNSKSNGQSPEVKAPSILSTSIENLMIIAQ